MKTQELSEVEGNALEPTDVFLEVGDEGLGEEGVENIDQTVFDF